MGSRVDTRFPTASMQYGCVERRSVRIFPNRESCPRLIRALAVERHEDWFEGSVYLNMNFLGELKKERVREAARLHAHQGQLLFA